MSFHSGRVTFCRFRVSGDAPSSVDETCLSILSENAFQETEIGAPDEVEVGWVTGEHLFDTRFSFEKNGYGLGGSVLVLAMRIDTHKVPADVKQAYRKMNEAAAASGNPSGFASKAQKREAADLAGRQISEDLAAGKFRKSKMVPVIWDLAEATLYCGASGSTVLEELAKLMKRSFAVEIDYLSAGTLAGEILRKSGHGRDYEDLKPSAFTAPPAAAREDHEDADGPRDLNVPVVPWVIQSVDLKDFLGNEFLIWLWWHTETEEGMVRATLPDGRSAELFLAIDKALDMDCAWEATGKQTLRGSGPTRLGEAGEALQSGKWPRKLGLILSDGEHQWELTLQGDQMVVSSAALPEIPDAQGPRELFEARLALIQALARTLDALYGAFVKQRAGGAWPTKRGEIREWIRTRRRKAGEAAEPVHIPGEPRVVVNEVPKLEAAH